ncbi:nitrate/nitrite transporter [Aureibacillus halotolerans]|uniref:NNP family nitrate/nitrite transporter-like MFS transporter n=1 Tax=Aureibacillus halotolerans TaxID=1508390 RepID=A0A4R6U3V3_9BACI|nr:MFS transporter [Aureibacillus halotolerans]TDQ40731.1 NNP family nitrate/nitrite transporter-like MFS transporter [Aureibacillus halotolerans]
MKKSTFQLSLQTSSLVIGFMIWVLLSSLMPYIREDIALTAGQASLVTAVPVVLGSVLRIPFGFYTDRIGARFTFLISFIILLVPVLALSSADSFFDLIVGGLLLGVGGATFSIGVTSLPKYYPKEKHGFINGIYGIGNIGTALTMFGAPIIASSIGWQSTIRLTLFILLAYALLTFLFGDRQETKVKQSMIKQMGAVYRNPILWMISLFYFITFGAFVAFTVFLPSLLVDQFGLGPVDAGIRTAIFIAIATAFRPIGGWLADRYNPYILLMIVFIGVALCGILLSFSPSLPWYTVGALAVAFTVGVGNGTIFKLVPLYFNKQAGIVNGIVSAMGGLGGFFPPLLLTSVASFTGHHAIAFMLLSEFAIVSFVIVIFLYYREQVDLSSKIIDGTAEGIMVTNKQLVIQQINPSFTRITGYSSEEVKGKTPTILQSGRHNIAFYEAMWRSIEEDGFWEGEIWNKRKNGEIYQGLLTISPMKNHAGETKSYVGVFNDVSRLVATK